MNTKTERKENQTSVIVIASVFVLRKIGEKYEQIDV